MSKKTFCKIHTTSGKDYYLLATTHNDGKEGIHLTLADGGRGMWCGEVTEDQLDDMAGQVKTDFHDYVSQTVKALTRENVGALNFIYQVTEGDDDLAILSWKKYLPEKKIKFQLGEVALTAKPDAGHVMCNILDNCIESQTNLKEQITNLQAENERLSTERTAVLKRLEKCSNAKDEIEQDLFSKFCLILNEKKARIRQLQEELENAPTQSVSKKSVTKAASGDGQDSDEDTDIDDPGPNMKHSGSDTDELTDEEKIPSTSLKRGRHSSPDPEDSSLILEEEESPEKKPAGRKRRNRFANSAPKKQTPSKPTLPKVSSTSSQKQRTSQRATGSLRKTSSTKSDNIDELMEDF